ncbi:MAG: hypothetical protein IJ438_01130 [Clostridia bacterium]|nr:hypothetical protein [Clostridia bacterium]MBQ8313691.1 hypothetical protein [Clostridia bacterium]MBQ8554451.1 hypothetical protein [Clostridia bacterium]
MNEAIMKALGCLNELEVHGERNCVLLVTAIRELKPLQTAQLVSANDAARPVNENEEE